MIPQENEVLAISRQFTEKELGGFAPISRPKDFEVTM